MADWPCGNGVLASLPQQRAESFVANHQPARAPTSREHGVSWVPHSIWHASCKAETRRARIELARIAVAEVAEEVRFDRRPGEERRVHLRVVEAGHRPAIQPERPRRQHEVRALQRTIAQRDVLQHVLRQVLEPRLGVRVREQLRQFLVEVDVHADDGRDGAWSCPRCPRRGPASASFASFDLTNTIRIGHMLAEVGPILARSCFRSRRRPPACPARRCASGPRGKMRSRPSSLITLLMLILAWKYAEFLGAEPIVLSPNRVCNRCTERTMRFDGRLAMNAGRSADDP